MKIKKYLEQSPVFSINAAYERIIPRLNRQLKEENLNLLQGLVLTALFFEQQKEVSPSQLADLFQTSRGNMSHILSHLEAKGWVKRVVHDKDARQFQIELKADGRKKALSLIRFYDQLQESFEKELGVQDCQRIVKGLQAVSLAFQKL
jgi:DNA-binding MarR family transcriptional regulator